MHVIRLRGPWELLPLKRYSVGVAGDLCVEAVRDGSQRRATMPADWCDALGAGFLGVVRYRRTFNRPTNLTNERIWLVVEPPQSCGTVRLNGRDLGCVRAGEPAGRFDIAQLLKDYNAVEIDVAHPAFENELDAAGIKDSSVPGGLVGEVWLEIEGD